MTNFHDNDAEFGEPGHDTSATARVIDGLELHGYQPSADEPDPRPLPETDRLAAAISDIFEILVGTLQDTRLEPDLDDLLWCVTDLFHKKTARVERQLAADGRASTRHGDRPLSGPPAARRAPRRKAHFLHACRKDTLIAVL